MVWLYADSRCHSKTAEQSHRNWIIWLKVWKWMSRAPCLQVEHRKETLSFFKFYTNWTEPVGGQTWRMASVTPDPPPDLRLPFQPQNVIAHYCLVTRGNLFSAATGWQPHRESSRARLLDAAVNHSSRFVATTYPKLLFCCCYIVFLLDLLIKTAQKLVLLLL